ncbi:MAG: hypothetical protein DHS20C05_22650 [Hyphococcus sp.]|nr:MAG: hypothetical protein DHS20C05_22650 [Marinicaulis sp.]
MTPVHAILIVIIRLWAAGVIITSSLHLSIWPFLDTGEANDPSNYAFLTFLNAGIWVCLGFAAWIFAPDFAKAVYKPTDEDPKVSINIDAETLVQIGSFLIGGFYLIQYLPQLFVDFGRWFAYLAAQDPAAENQGEGFKQYIINWRTTTTHILIVIIASFMALRSAYLAKLFTWLRSAGQYDEKKGNKE